jgi:hypothetical protein
MMTRNPQQLHSNDNKKYIQLSNPALALTEAQLIHSTEDRQT